MMEKKRGRPARNPYQDEAEAFNKAILASRLSPREVAYRFGRSEEKIREMMAGKVRPDLVIMRALG